MDDLNRALVGVLICKSSFEMFDRVRIGFDDVQEFCESCEQCGITSVTGGEVESALKIEVLDRWPNHFRPLTFHISFGVLVIPGSIAAECFDGSLRDFVNVL